MRIHRTRQLLADGVLPRPAPAGDVDGLRALLTALDLEFASEALTERLAEAARDGRGPGEFLDGLLRSELERREERRIRVSLRISGLPTGQTLSSFDFAFQPAVERSRVETLATCGWLRERQSLLIQGPPGVGKTHLAVALGVRAIECGFSTAFFRMEELLHAMKRDAELSPTRIKHKKYMAANLVILDEMGYQPFRRDEANLFFRLVSHRYGRGSLCVTTNKSVKDWPELLAGDEVLASAVLDRLLHDSHVLNIRGRSYRLRDLEETLRNRDRPASEVRKPEGAREPNATPREFDEAPRRGPTTRELNAPSREFEEPSRRSPTTREPNAPSREPASLRTVATS